MILNLEHCESCDALLTSADDEGATCTQRGQGTPPIRALFVKLARVGAGLSEETPDKWLVWVPDLTLGDVRLARKLLQ